MEYIPVPVSLDQARKMAKEKAWESLLKRGVDLEKVQDERVEEISLADGNGIHLTLWVEVEEDIGRFFRQ